MGHYKSNLRDLEFNLFEMFGADQLLGTAPFAQLDVRTAREVLAEVERLATHELAESFADADRHPPVFDAATSSVTMPASFRRSFATLMDGEWYRLDLPESLGGYGAPAMLRWAVAELLLGANPAAYMYMSGPGFASVLAELGTAEQKRLAVEMIERKWGATMVLTEPDAGSDVGAGRTKAIAQPDGTWHLEGVKRFITGAEWDVPENIVHFVLARPEGHGPGTKGLSLFVVPKFLVSADGALAERNGVYVTNVEKKMGLKVSTTCELTLGARHPAVGYLLGGVHDGIAQMFRIIENARMMVGTKSIATLSTAYLNALEFAKHRVQGADLTRMSDKSAPRVAILAHPDVRRSLMLQKSYAEGMRALVAFTALQQDRLAVAQASGGDDDLAARLNDLLLPVVKGFGSERANELLALSLQTLGGSGYLQDYPIEQYLRDAKIDTLYEGTTAIQGLDLFFRKIVRDEGKALTALLADVQAFAKNAAGSDGFEREGQLLLTGFEDVSAMVGALVGFLDEAAVRRESIYRVGLNTTRFLLALGDLIVAWLLLRQAEVAAAALDHAEFRARDRDFYAGKVAAARFFARTVLPQLSAARAIVESTGLELMDVPEAAF